MQDGFDHLLQTLDSTGKNYNIEKITKAFEFAKQLHEGQFRKSGEPYISHPVAVAEIVAGLGLDTDSICAALLHDTIEDCSDRVDLPKIKKEFGGNIIAFSVRGMSSSEAGNILADEYDICVRSGLHCAPLAHKHYGTLKEGMVRIALGVENTVDELNFFLQAVSEIAR